MIDRARQLGLAVMAGSMTESMIGISALAQPLPMVDCADDDGAVLLARDVATRIRVERGRCIYPRLDGTGVALVDGPVISQPRDSRLRFS